MGAWLLVLILPVLAACAGRPTDPPTLELKSPEDGVQVALGERVLVQSLARDDQAVVKTELWADGRLYEVEHAGRDAVTTTLDAIHIWEASTLGSHTLLVRAYDAQGQASQSLSVQIQVVSLPPTPTPAPTVAATVEVDPSCEPSARFVEDVTVPDDTLYNGGVNFRKTWRMRNDGECTWEPGTTWTFIEGDLLGANSPVEVELAEPERIVDVSVDMVAPTSPGSYRSYWRLQRPSGEYFGDQAYVRIIVP
jgi:hypothetical protein